jgi:hypothetical protein
VEPSLQNKPYDAAARAWSAAAQNASSLFRAGELALAAATVIGARSQLGLAGAADPARADYAELARIAPEKIDAFSRSGAAVVGQVWEMQREVGTLMLRQAEAGLNLALAFWQLPLPHHAAQLQADFVAGTVDRTAHSADRIAHRASRLHDTAMRPIHRRATANARRLSNGR